MQRALVKFSKSNEFEYIIWFVSCLFLGAQKYVKILLFCSSWEILVNFALFFAWELFLLFPGPIPVPSLLNSTTKGHFTKIYSYCYPFKSLFSETNRVSPSLSLTSSSLKIWKKLFEPSQSLTKTKIFIQAEPKPSLFKSYILNNNFYYC